MEERRSAEGHDLGDLVEEYGANSLGQLLLVTGGLAFLAGGLFMLWVAISPGGLLALFPGLGLPVAGALMLWTAFSMARLRVLLFEQGFIHREGHLARSFRWDEIEGVDLTETEHQDRHGRVSHYTHSFRIRASGGREVVLNDEAIGGGESLGRQIMREVQHCRLKGLLRRALKLEAAGERDAALADFEQLLRESPYNEIADQAREHIQRLRQPAPGSGPGETAIQGGAP